MDPHQRTNRASWDEKAGIHARGSAQYPIRRLLTGRPGWAAPIPDPLGPLRGRSMLHLQCHIGLDSLRWAKQGARVTGVDFSPRAIAEACSLSTRSGIPARFVETSVEALPRNLKGRFDVVISVYGVTCWLPNLARWAKVIRHFLKPGGFFYLAEIHPFWNATTYSKR